MIINFYTANYYVVMPKFIVAFEMIDFSSQCLIYLNKIEYNCNVGHLLVIT